QEQHGSGGEQKSKEADEQSHKSLSGREPCVVQRRCAAAGRIAAISIEFNCVGLMVALQQKPYRIIADVTHFGLTNLARKRSGASVLIESDINRRIVLLTRSPERTGIHFARKRPSKARRCRGAGWCVRYLAAPWARDSRHRQRRSRNNYQAARCPA